MNEAVDDHMDIARMGYADMLHDDERNRAYDIAIRICVSTLVKERNISGDKFFQCLDIGTGSGLLSMMIVRAFKELGYDNFHVTALEESKPIADCAVRIIEKNGMSKHITVIPVRCQQLEKQGLQFNLLVAELLDTELIGEGCLYAYADAVANLCATDCLFVPHHARVYVEPVASNLLFKRCTIEDIQIDMGQGHKLTIKVPPEAQSCSDSVGDDMQVSMLRPDEDFIRISEPKQVFLFEFNRFNRLIENDHATVTFPIYRKIEQPPVLVMWWDLIMYDQTGTTTEYVQDIIDPEMPIDVLSCAPTWVRSQRELRKDQAILRLYGRDAWRDHWLQSVHYLEEIDEVKRLVGSQAKTLTIRAFRDPLSFWFSLDPKNTYYQPRCTCGIHRSLSRNQLAFLQDQQLMTKLIRSAFYGKKASEAKFACHRPTESSASMREYGDISGYLASLPKWEIRLNHPTNQLPSNITLIDHGINEDIPWQRVFIRLLRSFYIHPIDFFVIKCAQVRFDNLNRIRTNIGTCEGFNLEELDKLLNYSSNYADKSTESYYLWEYGCKRLDEDYSITSSAIISSLPIPGSGIFWESLKLPIKRNCKLWHSGWALVFWAEFHLVDTHEVISTGPIKECAINERIEWNRYCKQIVYFMHDHPIPGSGDQLTVDLDVGINLHGELIVQRPIDYNESLTIRANNEISYCQ